MKLALLPKLCWLNVYWRKLLPILLVSLTVLLSSCNLAQFQSQGTQLTQLVEAEISDPKTFNSPMSNEANPVFGLILEGLVSTNGITGGLEPALAESWDISDDQQRITFTLREGLQWSDGQPLTVDDVVFSFNDIYFNPEIPSGESDILRVGKDGIFPSVVKLDERRVEFRSPEPFAPLLRYAGGIPLLPKHALADDVFSTGEDGKLRFLSAWGTDTPPQEIIGSGPFRLLSYQPAERVVLEKNPYYWRKDAQGNGLPYIERFVIQIVDSVDTELMQFRSGGLDILGVPANYFMLIKREEKRGDFTIYNGGSTLSNSFLTFNLNQGKRQGKPLVDPIKSRWFNTLEFRRAMALAIDRQTMITNIYQGIGEPQNSPIYRQSPYYLSPQAGLPVYSYDPKAAKALLLEAGFKYSESQQLVDADGNPVRFTLITNAGNKIREAMGAQIKQDLANIGITVDFQPVAFNTLVAKLSDTLDWEAHILGFSGGGVEPDSARNIWSVNGTLHAFNQGAQPGQDSLEGRIVSDWEEKISQLYIAGSQELDENKRKAIYAETQKLTQDYLPFIYLVNPLALSAVRNHIEGIKFSALGGSLWNIYELKIGER